ncbi:MAG: elongation factor P maturation arginine rhamnosyltransferase EarP [Burkholderiales bacterium]|jgi:uncharacterized repeat protein (TIGR03837 family)
MHAPAAPADRTATAPGRRWDLFCAVVDNLGDAAIGWRLARQLASEHGLAPRLWIDRPDALATLVPDARPGASVDGVRIEHLDEADPRLAATAPDEVADVVVGMLAGAPPEAYRAAMRTRVPRATWVAFEYLSAEPWIATHHGLPSPKPDGLVEHFFFPGFGPATGGLLRERDLIARREAFEADPAARAATLAALGVAPRAGERLASLFCYPDAAIVALLDAFAARPEPWRVLVPRGVAPASAGHPVAVPVPFVPQRDYDTLLWSCDLNLVRGEESFVRALWAARPMLWQAYRQDGGAHRAKVRAFVDAWARDAAPSAPALRGVTASHEAWNAPPAECAAALPGALHALLDAFDELAPACRRWAGANAETPDLATRLVGFVGDRL